MPALIALSLLSGLVVSLVSTPNALADYYKGCGYGYNSSGGGFGYGTGNAFGYGYNQYGVFGFGYGYQVCPPPPATTTTMPVTTTTSGGGGGGNNNDHFRYDYDDRTDNNDNRVNNDNDSVEQAHTESFRPKGTWLRTRGPERKARDNRRRLPRPTHDNEQ